MQIYFNEESDWKPNDDSYIRGIPQDYEEILEKADGREPVPVEGEGNGLIQNLEDGYTYGILETRKDPFKEYILEIGEYKREAQALLDVKFIELEHLRERAKIIRTGKEERLKLIDIQSRLISDSWATEVIEMEDIDLENYTPIN